MNRTAIVLAFLFLVFPSNAGAIGVESSAFSLADPEDRHFNTVENTPELIVPASLLMLPSEDIQRRKAAPLESNGSTSPTWFYLPRSAGTMIESKPASR